MKSQRFREWTLKTGLILLAVLWLTLVAMSWANQSQAQEAVNSEYSFSWLDPDKKIYVLQNRRYQKAGRAHASLMAGPAVASAYRNIFSLSPRLAYYFNEWLGVEAMYIRSFNSANGNFDALRVASGSSVLPVVREIKDQMGLLLHYSPWYAKINVFNKVLYFDWYFTAGAGMLNGTLISQNGTGTSLTETTDSRMAGFLGTGHQFHLGDVGFVRLDMTCAIYSAPVFGTSGSNNLYSNYHFGFGIGAKL